MFTENDSTGDFRNPHDMLACMDIMSELLTRFIERGIELKDRVEDLGCFITDAMDPLTDEEIEIHRAKLKAIRNRYRDLY